MNIPAPIKTSPQKAIALFCRGCVYDPKDKGTYTEQIEACQIITCELHPHRPLSGKTKRAQREKYLASLSPEVRAIKLAQQAVSAARLTQNHVKGVL